MNSLRRVFFLSAMALPALSSAQNDVIAAKASIQGNRMVHATTKREETYSITITVTDIRNHDGVLRFKFFDDSTPFPSETGFLKLVVSKSEVTGDSLHVTCRGFTSKNMGIALLDDENNNLKLDFGWFLPKEGHAFSNYYHTSLKRPVYKDFRFLLTGDKKVIMKMKYY
ncbi:MAG TPA: DUF2141 domain-containing protein [Cyclobacteriaceae bacterium]|nr:DUF2141 domain-containing protein [Cyclobacteriaceae bacterium]